MEREIFLDTAYAIALSSKKDLFHDRAIQLAKEIKINKTRVITTRAVMLEIGNALSGLRHRTVALSLLNSLEADPTVGIVPLGEPLYMQAFKLFQERQDKEWGIIDCVSFVVMHERGLFSALTTDVHFSQAGFRPLLRK